MQLISPRWKDRWNLTPAQWVTARTQYSTLLYPHGLPTGGVDVVEPDYTGFDLPAGCSSVTRYTINAPGQRPGGDPQHTYLFYPTTPRGVLVSWVSGHSGSSFYTTPTGGSLFQAILAAGYHILACEPPSFDWTYSPIGTHVVVGGTWTYSAGIWHNSGGVVTAFAEHELNFQGDGGPLAILQFVHHVIVSTTTAIATLSPTKVILAGHSGGGVCGHVAAALDPRFSIFCSFCPGLPYNQYYSIGGYSDWETYLVTEPFINPPYTIDIWGALRLAAAVPGRRTDVVSSQNDEFWSLRDTAQWYEDVETISDQSANLGNTFTYWLDPAPFPGHNMNPDRISRMLDIWAED